MLHIAICDDDKAAVESHTEITENCLKNCGSIGKVEAYTTSDNLLYDIAEDKFFFDLILLDIEMPGSTGMEIAEKIKPYLPNVKIIFITSHIEYAIDAFELSVFRYVPKSDMEKRLPAADFSLPWIFRRRRQCLHFFHPAQCSKFHDMEFSQGGCLSG